MSAHAIGDLERTFAESALQKDVAAASALELPEAVRPLQINWQYAGAIFVVHLLSLLALLPWFFSWTGVVVYHISLPIFGLLGISLCYHRILTHQGLVCPKWLERTFAILGVCCLQDTPARWVAVHRLHHRHSDQQPDPHSPLVNFLWSHMGWVFVKHGELSSVNLYEKYARDILRDPLYLSLERKLAWFWVYSLHAVPFFLAGFFWGRLTTGDWHKGVQFGSSLLVWGVFLRTVATWHGTWAVNSVAHLWGYRNYETSDDSRNHWLVALLAWGEGWHNNHHEDQRAAAHGHKWWEFDSTYCVVQLLEWLGLAKNVVRPRSWRAAENLESAENASAPQTGPDPAAQ
jgi:stearoyl-CoA desaturase (delta-9 desaturase)